MTDDEMPPFPDLNTPPTPERFQELAEQAERFRVEHERRRAEATERDEGRAMLGEAKWVWPKSDGITLFVLENSRERIVWEGSGADIEPTRDAAGELVTQTHTWFNGYAHFERSPVSEVEYNEGIAVYVPVHGGITFDQPGPDGSRTFGFDTEHACDDPDHASTPMYVEQWGPNHLNDIRNPEWLGVQCHLMAEALILLGAREHEYLTTTDNDKRAAIIDEVWAELAKRFKRSMDPFHFQVLMRGMFGGDV